MKGHIRKRGSAWCFVVELGYGEDGKRKQKWRSGFATRKAAEAELARTVHELNSGAYVGPSRLTVGEFLTRWLEDSARPNVAGSTYERYECLVRIHLSPALGTLRLTTLTAGHIQGAYARALEAGLTSTTVLQVHRILKHALADAVKWRFIAYNPAAGVDAPRKRPVELTVLDEPDSVRVLLASRGTRLHLPIVLAVASGARRGEILAIRWSDVDLDRGSVTITRSIEATRDGLAFKSPKSARGIRVLPLPAFAVSVLQQHREEQEATHALLGLTLGPESLVVAHPDGQPIHPDRLTRQFSDFLQRTGLPDIRLHDLRHGHCCHLLRAGVPINVVVARMGHSTAAFTLNTYAHLLGGEQESAARKIDSALAPGLNGGVTRPALTG